MATSNGSAALPLSGSGERPLVFVSYSKDDRSWLDGYLLRHLGALEQEGLITAWTDSDIDLGGEWLPPIVEAMRDAEVALCLISASYLKTPFCVKEGIPYLLERQRDDGLEVVFVLLSPCNWAAHAWLSSRQMLPRKGKSVSVDYKGREDEVFTSISQHITKVLSDRLPVPRAPEVSPSIRQILQQLEERAAAQTDVVRQAVETDPALSFEEAEAPAWPALPGGGLFGLFHEGGIAGVRPPAVRYADAATFDHAPRYHGGGFAGSGLLPDEVPIIARRGELVVPPERVVREEKMAREQRPITVVVNVTAADASSFRASQGQIAADMARAIDRASRNR
jgi:hypothetical protein